MTTNAAPIPQWAGGPARKALAMVRAHGARHALPCCLCREAIDYGLRYPSPWSCSVQHILSRARYPALTFDPANMAPAHLICNQRQGDRAAPDLGVISEW